VILVAHDYHSLPIGRATSVSVDASGNLIAVVEFASKEQNPQGDQVFNLYLGGVDPFS
jgi:hypothetical protein